MSHLTARYGFIHGAYWMAYAAVSGYASLYLLDLGFSNGTIGILIALAGVLSALLQPLAAGYADRPDSLSLKTINIAVALLAGACGIGLLAVRKSQGLTLALYALVLALLQLSTPLVNSLGVVSINCGCKLNYGVSKSVSSVTFALTSFLLGRLAARFGGLVVPIAIGVCYAVFVLSLCLYPKQKGQSAQAKNASSGFFRKYPRFLGVLAGCVLVLTSHVFLNSFTLQVIRTKGGGSSEMGTAIAIAALSEIPTMLLFSGLLKKKSSAFWMRLTGFFFVFKTLGSLLCTSVAGFYFFQATQIGAWALITVASVYYINALMEPQDAVKGQAYYTTSYTLASAVGGILGGKLIDTLGVNAMLLLGTVCAALGTAIVCIFTQKVTDKV